MRMATMSGQLHTLKSMAISLSWDCMSMRSTTRVEGSAPLE